MEKQEEKSEAESELVRLFKTSSPVPQSPFPPGYLALYMKVKCNY